jgi:hypothetical protein
MMQKVHFLINIKKYYYYFKFQYYFKFFIKNYFQIFLHSTFFFKFHYRLLYNILDL